MGIGPHEIFTLDVLDPRGVSICGMGLNTFRPAGVQIQADVYRHKTRTDSGGLTEFVDSDWCHLGTLRGTSGGWNVPSPMTFGNPRNDGTLDLPFGRHVLAIGGGNLGHLSTLVQTSAVQSSVDPGNHLMCLDYQPTWINARIDFTIPVAPITRVACSGYSSTVGGGCGCDPIHVFEVFDAANAWDLSANDLLITSTGIAIVPQTTLQFGANNLLLADDDSSPFFDLGFECAVGSASFTRVSVSSNGYIRLAESSACCDPTPTAAEWSSQGARIAPCWCDLTTAGGTGAGGVYFDVSPLLAVVTYEDVQIFGTASGTTFQVEIMPDSIRFRYHPTRPIPNGIGALVGFANDCPDQGQVSPVDLTAGATPTLVGAPSLGLTCASVPAVGRPLDLQVTGNQGLGIVLADVGVPGAGVALPSPPFAAACSLYLASGQINLGLTFAVDATLSLAVPNDPLLVGASLALQGVSLGPGPITVSNGAGVHIGAW